MKKIFFLLVFASFFVFPVASAQDIGGLMAIVAKISAEGYNIQNAPLVIHTTSFEKYCSMCEIDAVCCEYCNAPSCRGTVKRTHTSGAVVEDTLNLKFEDSFSVNNAGTSCPAINIKEGDRCMGKRAVYLDYDYVWVTVEGYDYETEKHLLKDTYVPDKFRFVFEDKFKLAEKDKKVIEKINGNSMFSEKDPEISYPYSENIIPAEDIDMIIPAERASEINETIENGESGIIVLSDRARNRLEKGSRISTDAVIGLSAILVLLIVIIAMFLNKKIKK